MKEEIEVSAILEETESFLPLAISPDGCSIFVRIDGSWYESMLSQPAALRFRYWNYRCQDGSNRRVWRGIFKIKVVV